MGARTGLVAAQGGGAVMIDGMGTTGLFRVQAAGLLQLEGGIHLANGTNSAVIVKSNATFEMSGGFITGCSAGSAWIPGCRQYIDDDGEWMPTMPGCDDCDGGAVISKAPSVAQLR